MKYVVTVQAEKTVYLEARVLVEIPDEIDVDEKTIQEHCEDQIMDFVGCNGVDWEEIDEEWPEVSGIDEVEVYEFQDEEAEIRFVLDKDGSLVPQGEAVEGKSE